MRIKGWGVLENITALIYPRRCVFCDEVILFENKKGICKTCANLNPWLEDDICEKCGKPLSNSHLSFCFDCLKQDHSYTKGRAVYEYSDLVKEGIYRYKYYNRREYGKIFASHIYDYYQNNLFWDFDLITAIPLHEAKLRERGYNQSAIIATELGNIMDVAVDNHLLLRTKNTFPQKELSDKKRKSNVKNAFYYNCQDECHNNILIIDDIYTTGSTIDSAAKCLKENGAINIYFLTLAIGKGF